MSRGVGRALGVVLAIAIPFAAPMIAGAIGGSALLGGISSAVGGAVTSAFGGGAIGAGIASGIGSGLVGAGLGAANAALTGGNIGQGALMGGLGSAISGGVQGFGAAKNAANLSKAATAGAGASGSKLAGMASAGQTITAATPGAATGTTAAGTAGGYANAAAQGAARATTLGATGAGTAAQGAARTMLGRISQSLGNASPDIMQKAAVFLASNVLSGTSAKENALIAQAAARMREIEGQNKGLYDMMLAEAQAINPQARGMQYYNDAQLQGIAAGQAAVEGMSPRDVNAKSEISRRYLQRASANATLAYRQGFESGETQRRSALGAVGNMPQYNAASGILGLEQTRRANQAANAAGIRSSLGTIITPDPGEANEDELLGGTGNTRAQVEGGMGG